MNNLEVRRVKLLIMGASDAGVSAALRAKELDPSVEVTMLLKDAYPNYSICGIPFFLGREVPDWRHLAHRTQEEIEAAGISVIPLTSVTSIDPGSHTVMAQGPEGESRVEYDRAVLATGAEPLKPDIPGRDLPGVFVLHDMDHAFRLDAFLGQANPKRAIIVGAGYIGCEMAESLARRGLEVTIMERASAVLPTVDPSLGEKLGASLAEKGIEVLTGVTVTRIDPHGQALKVETTPSMARTADLVLVVAGVRPVSALAAAAGATLGIRGAISVTRSMETSLPDVWAAGDCVETWHHLLERPVYLPLGSTAHKQGRVAGENALGGQRLFAGTIGTQVVKVFDMVLARTGLKDEEALAAGFFPQTAEVTAWDHKVYYRGASPLTVRLTGDKRSGRVLGAQMLGKKTGEIAKRIDVLATAIWQGMTVEELGDLDLSYTPPLGSPWDPVHVGAQAWSSL